MSAQGDEPAPLAESARRFVDAARPHERLSAERKAQLRGRVMAAIGAGIGATVAASAAKAAELGAGAVAGGAAGGAGAAVAGAGAVKVAGLSLFAKIGLSVAVVTLGAGGVLWSRAHEEPARPAITVLSGNAADSAGSGPSKRGEVTAPPGAEPAATSRAEATPGEASPASTGARPSVSGAAGRAGGSADPTATAEAVDSLTEENKLLARAHAALSSGDAGAALAILDEHAARFPRGTLAPERRATRAMALCKAGRVEEGRRELTALYGGDSKSPMAQKIDRACGK